MLVIGNLQHLLVGIQVHILPTEVVEVLLTVKSVCTRLPITYCKQACNQQSVTIFHFILQVVCYQLAASPPASALRDARAVEVI